MNVWGAGLVGLVIGSGIAMVLWLIDTAPEGWQDEHGFHHGKRPVSDEDAEYAEPNHHQEGAA